MKTFDVYQHPSEGYQAVKQGFGWPAFFFTVIWAFIKKMWGAGFAMLGIIIALSIVQSVFEQEANVGGVLLMVVAQLVFYIVVGVKGNDWRRASLEKRGFEKLGTAQAQSPDAAIASVAKPAEASLDRAA